MSASDFNMLMSRHRYNMSLINNMPDKEKRVVGSGVILGMGYLADNFGDPQGDKLVDASIALQSYANGWYTKGNDPLASGVSLVALLLLIKSSQDTAAIREVSADLMKLKDGGQDWARAQSTSTPVDPARQYPNNKKWEWSKSILTNRLSGQSFQPNQARRNEDLHCFEFADDMPHVRVYDSEIDFGEPLHKCAKCGAFLYKITGLEKCMQCGQMNNL